MTIGALRSAGSSGSIASPGARWRAPVTCPAAYSSEDRASMNVALQEMHSGLACSTEMRAMLACGSSHTAPGCSAEASTREPRGAGCGVNRLPAQPNAAPAAPRAATCSHVFIERILTSGFCYGRVPSVIHWRITLYSGLPTSNWWLPGCRVLPSGVHSPVGAVGGFVSVGQVRRKLLVTGDVTTGGRARMLARLHCTAVSPVQFTAVGFVAGVPSRCNGFAPAWHPAQPKAGALPPQILFTR